MKFLGSDKSIWLKASDARHGPKFVSDQGTLPEFAGSIIAMAACAVGVGCLWVQSLASNGMSECSPVSEFACPCDQNESETYSRQVESLANSPVTLCDPLTGGREKTWRLVGQAEGTAHCRKPFRDITFYKNGNWIDSHSHSGVWRLDGNRNIVFASEKRQVRCRILLLEPNRAEFHMLDWSPGLIVRLVPVQDIPD